MSSALGTLSERLDRRLDKSGECWEWTGSRTPLGYGSMTYYREHLYTHRAAWMVTNGPIPENKHVLHSCDNPPCCNPAHLHLGTPSENMQERDERFYGRKPAADAMLAVQITVLVPPETRQAFKRACVELDITMSQVLRRAIDEAILVAADKATERDIEGVGDG